MQKLSDKRWRIKSYHTARAAVNEPDFVMALLFSGTSQGLL